jgi:two-component sensor histidine kinase/CheY-like chemotaxis protein
VVPGQFAVTPEHYKVLIVPEDWDRLQEGMQSLLQDGQPHQAEFRVRRPSGEIRWCASTAAASLDGSGKVVRISGVTMDITERKEAEERQALLAREVDHRAKNAMAIVQSIVRLTKSASISSYVSIIEGRIKALSRAHALLSSSRWQGADLGTLIDDELAPYRSGHADRLDISGPKVLLEPTKAQTLALALHELATNAAKYGALSTAAGRLGVRWELLDDALVIHWHESAGPETHKPAVTGFGTQIITGSIDRQLGGKTEFEWLPAGLRCTLTVPRGERPAQTVVAKSEMRPVRPAARSMAARRVMIVEDEALVALVLADQLTDMGVSVVGPCGGVAAAKAAIAENDLDAAVLDVNLGGELVYPVAEVLHAKGIPFIFVTGYGQESIDKRFAFAPVLEKPIEHETLAEVLGQSLETVPLRQAQAG